MNGETFDTYVRTQLASALKPGDVGVLDNLNVHKSPRAAATIAERGARFVFLPRYAPELNPIEMAFAKLKAYLRAGAHRTIEALWRAIGSICDLYTSAECRNYFKNIAYVHE